MTVIMVNIIVISKKRNLRKLLVVSKRDSDEPKVTVHYVWEMKSVGANLHKKTHNLHNLYWAFFMI